MVTTRAGSQPIRLLRQVATSSRASSLFDLASSGVYQAGHVTAAAGELLPHRFTLTTHWPQPTVRRYTLCCTFPNLAIGRRYRPLCSVKPGLSSPGRCLATDRQAANRPAARSDHLAHPCDNLILAPRSAFPQCPCPIADRSPRQRFALALQYGCAVRLCSTAVQYGCAGATRPLQNSPAIQLLRRGRSNGRRNCDNRQSCSPSATDSNRCNQDSSSPKRETLCHQKRSGVCF